MFDFWILWNNARNLLYIKKFNDKKSIRLANNKLQTKNFLEERGIPFAKTYGVIKNRKELFAFDFSNLPKKTFVVKPNKGSKWGWVYILKYLGKQETKTNKQKSLRERVKNELKWIGNYEEKNEYYQSGQEIISDSQLKRYLIDTLDGKYSLTTGNDKILIEEKLVPGEWFKEYCEHGLADIRIIVFNLVPVAAMIRVPTAKSWGTANLAKGGIGFGIEVGTGKIKSMIHNKKIIFSNFSDPYKDLYNRQIPYRNDILALSSKIQFFVNLGYLALDWVITNDGPKLLEINARAWLEVQNITGIKLKSTLEKIKDMKIDYPEKGVEIAKTLFSAEKANTNNTKVIYLSQYGNIQRENTEGKQEQEVVVEVDLNQSEAQVAANILENIKNDTQKDKPKLHLNLYENDIILKNIKYKIAANLPNNKIILGKKTVENYLIKPMHKIFDTIEIINPRKLLEREKEQLHIIDEHIEKISKKLNISSIFKPKNYFGELDTFISRNGKYDPQFEYNRPTDKKIEHIIAELQKIKENIKKAEFKSWFAKLFEEKIQELEKRVNYINAYRKQDFKAINEQNIAMFWGFDNNLIARSKEKILEHEHDNMDVFWPQLTLTEAIQYIKDYLVQKKLSGIEVVMSYNNLSRVSVVMGKEAKILVSKVGTFREKELAGILAHEVDTHLMRYINGLKTGRNILKSGTGDYLRDEEGLAIYNENEALQIPYEKPSVYKEYFLINEAKNYSFSKLINLITFLYPNKPLEKTFKTAIRVKRGIENTSIISEWTTFLKDKIYLEWYFKIKNWIENWWDKKELEKWKVKIEDLIYM